MNTFYNETDNSNFPFFLRELAERITSVGQYNIDLIAKFVTAKGFGIKYRNTDSLYLTYPDKYYEHIIEPSIKTSFSKRHIGLKWLKLS